MLLFAHEGVARQTFEPNIGNFDTHFGQFEGKFTLGPYRVKAKKIHALVPAHRVKKINIMQAESFLA